MFENWDRLKVFTTVYSCGGIAAAAGVLDISQPAVSQTIRKLERELNTPLFTRLHRKLVPTSAGSALYNICRPFMDDLGEYRKSLGLSKDRPGGELRLGAPREFGKSYLSVAIAGFRALYPDVRFHLEFGTPVTLLPRLKKGEIDFVLVDEFLTRNILVGSLEMYHFDPLAEEEIILACSREYYKEEWGECPGFEDLAKEKFIAYREDKQILKQWFKHHFSKVPGQLESVLTVDSHEAVVSGLSHHIGMGIVTSQLVRQEFASGQLIPVRVSDSVLLNRISLVQFLDKVPTLTERVFMDYLKCEIHPPEPELENI